MMAKKLHQFKFQSFIEFRFKLIELQRFQISLHPDYIIEGRFCDEFQSEIRRTTEFLRAETTKETLTTYKYVSEDQT